MFHVVTASVAALTIASLLFAPSVALAKSGSDLRADLSPCCGDPEPNAEGKAEFKSQTRNGGTTRLDSVRIEVEIPLPSPGLGITVAADADLRVVLSRAGLGDYAECFLVLDEDEGDKASFELRILQLSQNGTVVFKKAVGQCDIDLGTSGIQPGVPAVVADDVATISNVDQSSTRIPFLQGTFAQH